MKPLALSLSSTRSINHLPTNLRNFPGLYHVTSSVPTAGWLADGVSAAANLAYAYDYYYNEHNRDSMDGEGGSLLAIVRLGLNHNNAHYNPGSNWIFFGDAEPYAGALDVVAHEFTHGVIFPLGQPGLPK